MLKVRKLPSRIRKTSSKKPKPGPALAEHLLAARDLHSDDSPLTWESEPNKWYSQVKQHMHGCTRIVRNNQHIKSLSQLFNSQTDIPRDNLFIAAYQGRQELPTLMFLAKLNGINICEKIPNNPYGDTVLHDALRNNFKYLTALISMYVDIAKADVRNDLGENGLIIALKGSWSRITFVEMLIPLAVNSYLRWPEISRVVREDAVSTDGLLVFEKCRNKQDEVMVVVDFVCRMAVTDVLKDIRILIVLFVGYKVDFVGSALCYARK